ncbi:fumarylacetoacetate hydrolase family protein [Azospira restricta]|uniref:Fumarylacetoacetate hydrolase family protein n=1 Tax=Azospira restricta TaxID=404405 RepID=A0A974SNW5_9RHOO|nr:fumarylacetoacetate hydrolase family protein [Azospira restricta]QRJ63747.1 fumarylacetoacetate hydrolase family protein [Azospira restricta]
MKFARLSTPRGVTVAVVDDAAGRYWPLAELAGFAGDMAELAAQYATLRRRLAPRGAGRPLAEAQLLAPLVPRRNLFCVGKNYREHAREFSRSGFDASAAAGEEAPPAPVFFSKPPSTIVGPGGAVSCHPGVTRELDYEAELAVVIGRGGHHIRRADAMAHVWGYTIVNDVTARDLQRQHRQWFLGKSLDTFCPMGPWIVTADEVDGSRLRVRCWINDELRQDASTADLIFDIPALIETLSAGIELHPGDVIATGTPAGVGIGFTPPRFLAAGDRMRIEVEGIGVLENRLA